MTKEQYIGMRNQNVVDVQLLYTYAVNEGFKGDPNSFMLALQYSNQLEILEGFDRKFELTLLTDKEGKFIKVVE